MQTLQSSSVFLVLLLILSEVAGYTHDVVHRLVPRSLPPFGVSARLNGISPLLRARPQNVPNFGKIKPSKAKPDERPDVFDDYQRMLRTPHIEENRPYRPLEFRFQTKENSHPGDEFYYDEFEWGQKTKGEGISPDTRPFYTTWVEHRVPGRGTYFNIFHPGKGAIYCLYNKKGTRDANHARAGNCGFESTDGGRDQSAGSSKASKQDPVFFSEILWHSYQDACRAAGLDEHHRPPLNWIVRNYIVTPETLRVFKYVYNHETPDSLHWIHDPFKPDQTAGPDGREKLWNISSVAAKMIMSETPQGRGILRFLTEHADTLGRRQIKMVGVTRLRRKVIYDDEDYRWSMKIELGDVDTPEV